MGLGQMPFFAFNSPALYLVFSRNWQNPLWEFPLLCITRKRVGKTGGLSIKDG